MKLISHCLTAVHQFSGIRSLIGFSKLSPPSPFSALPPGILDNAIPKAISGRTSYLRARLEFLRYPQVIPGHCNERGFGPPLAFTPTSTCSWIGHTVSGLWPLTSYALFTLALAAAPLLYSLTLPVTITRRTILQKVPHHAFTRSVCL